MISLAEFTGRDLREQFLSLANQAARIEAREAV
jgi:hypothetical protein